MRTTARSDALRRGRRPRLVVRFAVLTAVCLGVGAAAILLVTRHLLILQAQQDAALHAEYLAEATLNRDLSGADLRRSVTGKRRVELDRLFRQRVLLKDTVRATLVRRDGLITYSTDHRLIGRKLGAARRLNDALRGTLTNEVSSIDLTATPSGRARVLRSFVPVTPSDGGKGVATIDQDYSPIAEAAKDAFLPIAGILELVLLLLYGLLLPLLVRMSRRIERQMARIRHQAHHDDLTDLPNRLDFRERVTAAIERAKHEGKPLAVLLFDLDRFKEINDTLGHQRGDELLRAAADRLRERLGETTAFARLGGDEFAVLLSGADASRARNFADEIRAIVEEPFCLEGVPLVVEASLGIAVLPDDGDDVDALLQRADVAMYAAKEHRTGAELYDAQLDTNDAQQLALMTELRGAIEAGQLVLHYQPKADLDTGAICGIEALVRWLHPQRGLLLPGAFVPHAERTGLNRLLSRYVLQQVLHDQRKLSNAGITLPSAVNLSAFDLLDVSLPDEIARLLNASGVEAQQLEVEITETALMTDQMRARHVLERLSDLGINLSIDDYGTGYSSLSYLRSLPIDAIKIDKSFVLGTRDQRRDTAIVKSTIELGHNLGLTVIAEGIETRQLWDELQALGCDIAQGYYIARPSPLDELISTLTPAAPPIASAAHA
jgi:diguanylate cyclase (GGDEF)-like protein